MNKIDVDISRLLCVSVVRDLTLYETCIRQSNAMLGAELVTIDNKQDNQPIPRRYNRFLDGFDYTKPAWIIFVHEDFEFQEDISPRLTHLNKDALYGPIGCSRRSLLGVGMQVFNGQISECERNNPAHEWKIGRPVTRLTRTETFDCCCLIVHSSLIQKHHLRFDENLEFDLYVEDFCANAYVQHRIKSFVLPFNALHHSGSRPTERLTRHLPYLEKKYPHNCFTATCTYFGTMPLIMKWQRKLMGK